MTIRLAEDLIDAPEEVSSVRPPAARTALQRLNDEIRDANLTYLMLAQQLIRADRSEALYRLGLSGEVADILDSLTTAQVLRVASSNMLLARFRFDDSLVWSLLSSPKRDEAPSRMHAAILMASRTTTESV